jgi:hypothetical protein
VLVFDAKMQQFFRIASVVANMQQPDPKQSGLNTQTKRIDAKMQHYIISLGLMISGSGRVLASVIHNITLLVSKTMHHAMPRKN